MSYASRLSVPYLLRSPYASCQWISATALSLNLVVVTRNTADFQPMGVELFNPWDK